MKTDFSTPMTFYELIAIILAAVAIIIPTATYLFSCRTSKNNIIYLRKSSLGCLSAIVSNRPLTLLYNRQKPYAKAF